MLLLMVLWLLAPPPVCADYYRYTDKGGSVCFVDDVKKIPPACRASATLVREEKPVPPPEAPPNPYLSRPPSQDGTPFIAPAPAAPPLSPAVRIMGAGPRNWGWLALCLVAAAASLVLLYQLLKTLQSRQLARVILFVATMVVLVFGYKLYVDQMVSNYFAVKSKVLQLMGKAMQRTDMAEAEER